MIHEELEWCDVCEDCAQYKALGNDKYLCVLEGGRCNGYFAYKKLKAENASLRARLEKAVELPTIYEHISYPYLERMYSEIIYYVIYKENGRIMTEKFGKNKSKAEARLEEMKEKNSD
ncbi:MAG TPA: hypothetical protein H9677_05780 [Firmicutes bacterium]|nr:hypothetical protein [Bacillota bacterium]